MSTLSPSQIWNSIFDSARGLIRVSPSPFTAPVNAAAVTVTYPSDTQEVYKYRSTGITGTVLMTITVNYVSATKEQILNAAWTMP